MSTDQDIFRNKCEQELNSSMRFGTTALIFSINALILFSILCGCQWWERINGLIVFIACFIYGLYVLATFEKELHCIFSDYNHRLKDWENYCESKQFIYDSNDIHYAPIRSGDYVRLSDDSILEFGAESRGTAKDFTDFNIVILSPKAYFKNIKTNEIRFLSKKDRSYSWSDLLYEIYQPIKDEGKSIVAVYNKFGDVKWRQNTENKPINKVRKHIVLGYKLFCGIVYLAAAFLPIWALMRVYLIEQS